MSDYSPQFQVGDEAWYVNRCIVTEASPCMIKIEHSTQINEDQYHPASGFLKGPLFCNELGTIVEEREKLIEKHREENKNTAKMKYDFYNVLKLFSRGYGPEDEKRAMAFNLMREYFGVEG